MATIILPWVSHPPAGRGAPGIGDRLGGGEQLRLPDVARRHVGAPTAEDVFQALHQSWVHHDLLA